MRIAGAACALGAVAHMAGTVEGLQVGIEELCATYESTSYLGGVTSLANNSDVDAALEKSLALAETGVTTSLGLASMFAERDGTLLSEFDKPSAERFSNTFLEAYAKGFIVMVAPGIVFGLLSVLSCPYCFFCCSKCCCKKRDPSEYNALQKLMPIVFYFVFSLAAVALALVAIQNIGSFVDGTMSTLCGLDNLNGDFTSFVAEITSPVDTLESATTEVIDYAETALGTTSGIESSFHDLTVAMDDLVAFLQGFSVPGGFTSSTVDQVSANAQTASAELGATAQPAVQALVDASEMVQSSLVSARSTLTDQIGAARGQMDDQLEIRDALDEMLDFIADSASKYMSLLTSMSYAFFSTVFIAFAAGLLVILTLLTPCKMDDKIAKWSLKASWICTYFFMTVLFFLSGAFIPFAVLLNDGCQVVFEVPSDFDKFVGGFFGDQASDPSAELNPVDILKGCFAVPSVPIMEALNVSASFGFLDELVADLDESRPNLTSVLDFSLLDSISGEVENLSRESFGLRASSVPDAMGALNDFVGAHGNPKVYTEADCTATPSCDYDCLVSPTSTCASDSENPIANATELAQVRRGAVNVIAAGPAIDAFIDGLDASLLAVNQNATSFNDALVAFDVRLGVLRNKIDPMTAAVSDLGSAGNCSFVAVGYWSTYESLCNEALPPLTVVSSILLVIALCGIPLVITGLLINNRIYGGNKPAAVWADKVSK